MPSIVDVPSDQLEPHERRIARITHEESSFNADHYMLAVVAYTKTVNKLCCVNDRADYMEDEQIQVVLKYQPEWTTQLKQWNEQVRHIRKTGQCT